MYNLNKFVKIVEVGPRDGLQNIKKIIPTYHKVNLINKLSTTGLNNIEITSFVSPKWIPQMADSKLVCNSIQKEPHINYSALVPNKKGLLDAISCNINEIELFTSAGNKFCKKNLNCDIYTSLCRFRELIPLAKQNNIRIRGCISCIFEDPFDGPITPFKVCYLASFLRELGCDEIVLADTTGIGTPNQVNDLTKVIKKVLPINKIAYHFHNTHHRALPNVLMALQHGVRIFDSSIAGLGGCPYAQNATGNVATEDLIYLLHKQGYYTNINLNSILKTVEWIKQELNITPQSVITGNVRNQI